jgi:formiminotetrahydrofolate cyclodeaminase
MNKGIRTKTLETFLDMLAGDSPTPGGGAVAAFAGAMAAALVEMVCHLTIGKKKYASFERTARVMAHDAGLMRKKLLRLAEQDIEAFDAVMVAYKSKCAEKIRRALLRAIKIPALTKDCCIKIQRMAIKLSKKGNKNAVSDAQTASFLAGAAIHSAQANITINKKTLARLS